MERDVLLFIAQRYEGRHLDIEVAQLGLSNAAASLIFAHPRHSFVATECVATY